MPDAVGSCWPGIDQVMRELAELSGPRLRRPCRCPRPRATAWMPPIWRTAICSTRPARRARFGIPADCLRRWARETRNTPDEIGRRKGGRWLVSIPRLQRRINGG